MTKAIFGKVRRWFFMIIATRHVILGDCRKAQYGNFWYKMHYSNRKKSDIRSKQRFYYPISSDYSGNYLSIGGGISRSFHSNLALKHFGAGAIFSNIGGKFACSTHQQCHFIYNKDYSYNLFCVAGVIFGEVGRWLRLFRVL